MPEKEKKSQPGSRRCQVDPGQLIRYGNAMIFRYRNLAEYFVLDGVGHGQVFESIIRDGHFVLGGSGWRPFSDGKVRSCS